jgi:hypothetical protein
VPEAATIKLDSDAGGRSGEPLAAWAPRNARRIVVTIAAMDDVAAGDALDAAPEFVLGSEHGTSAGHDGAGEREPAVSELAATSRSGALARIEEDAGRDPAGTGQQPGAGVGPAGGPGAHEPRLGHAHDSRDPSWVPGGTPGIEGGRIGDPVHGRSWGNAAGEPGATGHTYGTGLLGVLDVPADMAPLVNAATIVADANLAGFGKNLLRQAVDGIAESVLRARVADEARRVARANLGRVARRIDELEAYRHLLPA